MRTLFIFLLCLFSVSSFAASNVSSINPNCAPVSSWPPSSPAFSHDAFCAQFAAAAYCHCQEKYDSGYCHQRKVKGIFDMMIKFFGSLDRACEIGQKDVDKATCIQQWNYYNNPQAPCPAV